MDQVVIVDDVRVLRSQLRLVLDSLGMTVVAECESISEALLSVKEHHPDFVFLDLSLPETTVLESLNQILSLPCVPKVIAVASISMKPKIELALENGAAAFLPKPFSARKIQKAIETAIAGDPDRFF